MFGTIDANNNSLIGASELKACCEREDCDADQLLKELHGAKQGGKPGSGDGGGGGDGGGDGGDGGGEPTLHGARVEAAGSGTAK